MIKLVVFDLDGTLCEIGKEILPETVRQIKKLEESGVRIALSSGKPTFYLCGMARQLGLKEPILVGENGAVLQLGVALPPSVMRVAALPKKTRETLDAMKHRMEREFENRIWYQPNQTALTPFLYHKEDFPPVRRLIEEMIVPESELTFFEHCDCYDVVWDKLTKKEGIRLIAEETGITPSEMVAVGDWTNDYPMFEAVGLSVGIHLPDPDRATVDLPDIQTALRYIISLCETEKRKP